jgi:microcystin-dependent protein
MAYAQKEELKAVRQALLAKIEDLYLKIYGRDPDGLITLAQIDPTALDDLRRIGDFYRKGERIPANAIPGEFVTEDEMLPYVRGIVNNTVYARTIVDEIVTAREGEASLKDNLNDNYLQIADLLDEVNALEEQINLDVIDGYEDICTVANVIAQINDSEEEEQIDVTKINLSILPGVVDFNCPVFCLDAAAPTGWAIANGSQYLIASYPVAATRYASYGTPDPGYFCVPDMRGMVPVGFQSGDASFGTLKATVGSKTHTLAETEMPIHTHNQGGSVSGSAPYVPPCMVKNDPMGTHAVPQAVNVPVAGATGSAGGGEPHNNIQPSIVGNYIVRLI